MYAGKVVPVGCLESRESSFFVDIFPLAPPLVRVTRLTMGTRYLLVLIGLLATCVGVTQTLSAYPFPYRWL